MLKKLSAVLFSALLISTTVTAANNIHLPNIGTAALSTLSIDQEIEMGDFYLRMLRGNYPLNQDPLINHYINQLGNTLAASAESVQTPFHFFIMQSRIINAFAFFGGNVVIHSKLILETETESELASVMSHEIGHVTQRHLARAMESQKKSSPYVWGSALGSILLSLANPSAGIAALTTTLASSQQSILSFSQNNEQEADRVGLKTLTKAGFNPHASTDFLQKLADNARYSSKPPEMLLTHPLPDSRLSDIRNRVNQLKPVYVTSSLDYYLAKMRLVVFSNSFAPIALLREDYAKIDSRQTSIALRYGEALTQYRNKNYVKAAQLLTPLLNSDSNNLWFIDLMTDIDLAEHNDSTAINRIQMALKHNTDNQVLQLNLANAYLNNNELQKAASLLHRYTYNHNDDTNGWNLLANVYSKQWLRGEEMSTQAELSALQGQFSHAITLLTNAKTYLQNKPHLIARNDARIKQLEMLKNRYANYQH